MRIAIVGGGGAGLTSAWLLENDHQVTLYEKQDRLGGHAHTINLEVAGEQVSIDAGFEFISQAMFPTFLRLLNLVKVPLKPFTLYTTQYDTRTGDVYMMPPFHGLRPYFEAMTPRKILDLLRFRRTLRAVAPIMDSRDTSVTVEQFVDSLSVSDGFKNRFLYPFWQAGWGVSLEDIKSFMVYDVARYAYLSLPSGIVPRGWREITGGTQTYVKALRDDLTSTQIKLNSPVTSVRLEGDGYLVEDAHGHTETFDHIVLATNAHQAAAALENVPDAQTMRQHLSQISYFETKIAVHGDTRLMPPRRKHWSTVNIRFDGTYSQLSVWKSWKSSVPVFRSWITHEAQLPDPLYAVATYHHPSVDAGYFAAQRGLEPFQGINNLWLAGVYTHDIDSHESAVISGIKIAQKLAPNAPRLRLLTVR
jgi:predicted NAD/FAD-binding protein